MRNLVAGIIVSLGFAFPVFSQNINMSNGSGTACSGTFYDNGGNGNYSNNQTITYTICPSVAGNRVVMNFSTFALENNYDFLTIYDGNNTSAPTLGTYTGNSGPGLVSATSTNTSGCLTFVFISNSSGVAAGWVAGISCATPCQTITSNLVSSSPATNSGIIRVCQGQTVTFNGSGTFSNSGAGATYLWSFGDGTTGSGTSVTHTYPNPGSYLVNLTITDPSGCHNSNHLNQVVQVSTTPTINLTASPATLCVGATAALNATVTPTPFTANCTPPVSGTTFLPDGSGVSYTTAVNVNCYGPFQTVSSASDIQSVCLNLEHSYLGDLRIRLICPNGQSMTLKAYPGGGGTYLGSPLDDPAVGPGTGSTYCFTPSATTLLVNGPTVTAGSPSGNSIVAGNYMPVDPFSNMVGCPLNGAWTIEVTDNLAVDNGYIFNWDVTFAPGLTPANLSFTPTIVSQGWVPAAGLTNVNATQANVTPAVPGSNCYTYSVTDNFGCTYTQNICVNATAGPTVNVTPATLTICAGQTINLSAAGATSYTWTGPNGFTANTANISIPNATVAAGGTYTVIGTNASGCSTTVTRNVVVNPLPATPNFTVNSPLCTGNTLNLNGPTVAGATYVWSGPNGFSSSLEDPSVASVTAAAAGTYSLYVVVGGCTSATATRTVVVNPTPATPNFTTNSPVCAGGTLNLNGPTVAGATYVWSGPNGFSSSVEDPSISAVTAAAAGTYSLYVLVNGCTSATATQNVVINPLPPTPNFTTNSPLCQGQQLNLYGPNIAGANYYWSGPGGFTQSGTNANIGNVTVANAGTYSLYVVVSGCTSATATQSVVINPTPATPNFTSNSPICAGGTLSFNAPAVAGATYVWSGPNGFTSALEDPSITSVTTAASGTYSLYTVVSGCTSATATGNVVVNPIPATPNFTTNSPVCAGFTLNLNGPTVAGATYVWSGPNGFTSALEDPSITSVTTAASGTYSLYVVVSGCTSATATQNVTVNPIPATPVFTTNSPVCAGFTLNLNGPTVAGATYVWSGPNGFTSALEDPSITSVTTAASGTYSLYVVVNGCTSATATRTVTINPIPATPNFTTNSPVCAGFTLNFNAPTVAGATYVWSGPNGFTSALEDPSITSVTTAASGTYSLYVVVSGCTSATATQNVIINPIPATPNFTTNSPICAGSTLSLNGPTVAGATYVWSGPNGFSSSLEDPSVASATTAASGTYSLYVVVNGCTSATATQNVTVYPIPATPNFTTNSPVCAGFTLNLNGPTVAGATYVWSGPNGFTSSVEDPSITSVTTAASGTYSLYVVVNGCTSATATQNVTINPIPATPNFTTNSPVCAGFTLNLNGPTVAGATYVWSGPNGFTSALEDPSITSVTTAASGTYSLYVVVNGCTSATATQNVTIHPIPATPNFTTNSPVCAGFTLNLNGPTVAGATYVWSGPNGFTSALEDPSITSVTTAASGTYSLYVVVNGCTSATATQNVTINPIPATPNFTTNSPVCAGFTLNLNGPTVAGATYVWSGPNGFSSSLEDPSIASVTTAASGTYSLYVVVNGCTSATATQNVTINPIPATPNFSSNGPVCAGATLSFNAPTVAGATYVWSGPNGFTSALEDPSIPSATTAASGSYSLYVVVNGCTSATATLNAVVNPLPNVNAGPDQTICIGASVTLSGSGAVSYTWDNGVTNGVAFNPTTTTTYTVTGTDANTCQNTDQVTVTVNPLPVVSAGPDQTICVGASVTLNGSGAVTYAWDNGVTNGVAFNPTTTTTYTVTGIDANSCQNTDQVTVTVNPLPIVNAGADQTICIGAAVTLSGSGAVSYTWNNGVTNGVAFNPTTTTTYTVTGTDANNCQNTDQVTVTVNPLPIVNAGADQTICIGASVTLSGSGAVSYTWDNGVTNGVAFNPTTTTTYTVTGTDANSCQNTDQVTVTVNPLPVVNAGPDQTICIGAAVTLNGSGAVSYTWDNGVTNGVAFNPTTTTTYTVTGTDANTCQNTDQVTVTVNPLPIVNAGPDQTICIGASVTLSGSGAVSYTWDNGVTNGVAFNPTTTTTYTVTGTDANNCQNTDQVTVTVNPLPIVNAGADQTICIGASVTLSGSGAVSYTWNNGVTNGVAFNPTTTTTYTVTGTDANSCQNTDQVTVTVNPLPIVNAGPDQTICVGASVTLNGSGAVTYAWDNGVTNGVAFNPTTTTTYTVTGTDANTCQNTDQVTVTVNPLPIVNAGPDQTICIGASVTLSGSGAVSYTWDNGVTNGVAFNPTATTTYTVTGTDANSCQNTDQVTVTVNPLPIVNAGPDQTICIGAAVTLNGSGAVTYTWDNGVTDGVAFNPTTTTTYTVTGTDANSCQNTDQVTVTVNPLPVVNAGPDQTICVGASVTLNGSGAVTYAWDNGVTNGVAFNPTTTTTYTVTGTDANTCQNTDQITVTVNPLPIVNAGPDQTICIGASVTLSGSGAVSYTWDNGVTNGVAFNPTATTTYTVTGTDANSCQNTDQVTVTVNPLPIVNAGPDQTICIGAAVTLNGSGAVTYTWDNGVTDGVAFNPTTTTTYTVTGTDANTCQNTDQVTVTVNPLPIVNAGPNQAICDGSPITLSGSGAVSYAWDNGVSNGVPFTPAATATYTVTGTDANGCQSSDQVSITVNTILPVNAGPDQTVCSGTPVTLSGSGAVTYTWDNGVTDGVTFVPTATATYTVTGMDANNCQNSDQVTITVNIRPVVDAGPDQTVCAGTSVTLNGSGALTYTWDNGVTDGLAFVPASTITYTVIGTDVNTCNDTDQVTVNVNPLPVVIAGADQTICVGAAVTLSGSGAVSYTWDNGVTDGVAFNPTTTTTYTVTGTDANSCQNTDQVTVTVNPLPVVNAGADQTICIGAAVTLSGSGAVSYTWDNGVTDGVAFNPTTTTTYTVTGTDANNCQNTDQVTVTINPLPIVNAGADQTICIGASVTLSGSGAVSYTWDNGVTNGVAFNPTTTTTYTVTGTDANTCQNTDQVTVTVNPLPVVNAGADQTICVGASVTLNGSGAVTYAWDNGVTNGVAFNPTTTTTYTVTGTDANTCQNTDQVTVTVNPLPIVNAGADQTICIGASVILNGSGAVTYAWDNGVTNGVAFNPTTTTTYTVTGTDANTCQNTDQVTVTVNPLPAVNAGADQTICIGASVTLSGSGAVTYTWDNGVTNGVAFNPTMTTTYTVTGTDANTCQNTDQVTVTVNPLPVVNAGADQTICVGASLTLNGSGAVSYTWDNGVTNGVAFNPTITTTYTVTGTDANTCQNTDQVTVTVNPLPVVNAGADQTICIGAAVTLSGSGAVSYTWDNGVTNGVAFNPTTTTTYTVTGTDANTCQNTDQVTVTVNPLPAVNAGADQTICIGASVTLSGSGAVSYTWDNGVTNGVAFNPTTTTTYTVTGTDANTCQNTDQVTVTVNPLPVVNAGADQTICVGASVTLNGSGAVSYTWDNGVTNGVAFNPTITTTYTVTGTDANTCQNTDQVTVTVNPLPVVNAGADQTICIGAAVTLSGSGAVSYTWDNGVTNGMAFNPTTTTTYTVTGTDANTCQNTDQVTVTVNPLPVVNAGADQTICIGASVTLSGSGAVSYTWDNGVTNGVAFNPTTTTTYTVTGTDANTCQNTDQVTVTVNPLPIVNAGADQTICIGAAVTLSGSGAVSYTWDNGVTDGVAFNPTTTTTYTVTGTDANTCQNTDQLTVTVNPLPLVNAGPDQTVCAGTSVTLSGLGATSFSWDNGVSNGVSFVPTVTTTYTVTGTDANTCQNTDQVTVTVNPLPIVNAGPDLTVCAGTSVTLSGSGALSYAWDNGVSDGVAFVPGSTLTYTVTGTDANACQNTDQLTVTVNAIPPAPAITAAAAYCAGDNILLDATTIPGASYYWGNPALFAYTEDLNFSNANVAHSGTYSVYVVVSGCTSATTQHTLVVNPTYARSVQVNICQGSGYTFQGVTYQNAGQYLVSLTTTQGCDSLITLNINLMPQPVAGFDMPAQTSVEEPAVQISDASFNATTVQYYISTGDVYNTPDIVYTFMSAGDYSVTQVVTNGACVDSLTQTITVTPVSMAYIPNSFTPDGDGINDEWKPVISYTGSYTLLIFDRWGELIFESDDVYKGWNGNFRNMPDKPVQQGTYVYKIRYRKYQGDEQELLGHINLLR